MAREPHRLATRLPDPCAGAGPCVRCSSLGSWIMERSRWSERVSGKGQSVRGSRYPPVHGGGALSIGQCRFIHQWPPGPDRQPNGSAGEQPRTGTVFSHLSGTDGCTGGQQGLAVACAGSGQASLATSLTLHESRERQDGICVLEQPRRGEAKREGLPGHVFYQDQPWHCQLHPPGCLLTRSKAAGQWLPGDMP